MVRTSGRATRAAAGALAALCLVAPVACGGTATSHGSAASDEQGWADSVHFAVRGFDQAVGQVVDAGSGKRTLTDTSLLYEALLGYTYLGGCGETIVNLGPAPNRFVLSERLLQDACSHFARAGEHFTGAVEGGRTDLLGHAVAEALAGWRMLPRATEALARR
jgi:hypothetical protein